MKEQASFKSRLLAYLIDIIIIIIVGGIVGGILGFLITIIGNLQEPMSDAQTRILGISISFIVSFLYFGYFWSNRAKSIGMGVTNIQVLSRNGDRLSFLTAGLRGTIGYYISGLVFGLGFFWALADKNNETWHDKIFSTKVVVN